MAVMSGPFGSSENSAVHGRLASSFQCTVTDVAVDETVTGPAFTRDPSKGTAACNSALHNRNSPPAEIVFIARTAEKSCFLSTWDAPSGWQWTRQTSTTRD